MMSNPARSRTCVWIALLLAWGLAGHEVSLATETSGVRFEVTYPSSASSKPITGRLFLMISRRNEPEVRLQSTWFNSPQIVAIDVRNLKPGERATIDGAAVGTPLRSLDDLSSGQYYAQAVMNLYTEFRRADGRVVWAHMDQWEGQQFNTSPGNLYSPATPVSLDPKRGNIVQLTLSEVIPPARPLVDTEWINYVKIQSPTLTRFWGRPIYIGAIVLLPRDYARQRGMRYPAIYFQRGHFSLANPFGFRTDEPPPESEAARKERESAGYETGYEFQKTWRSDNFPRMIAISLLDPTPFADWSGGVNSVNNGPYADAIMKELIPHIEERFRIVREPYARVLTGNASGGRAALAFQLQQPDFFGGAWIFQPWPFNFRHYSTLDIYNSDNAFTIAPSALPGWARPVAEWIDTPRYIGRIADGTPFVTFQQLSQHDAVMAGMAAGDPIGADDAILGPTGPDGYPEPLWDRTTGKINRAAAEYWRNGDLAEYAVQNWGAIGPKLVDKLHFYAGERDHFYRNEGVHALENSLRATGLPLYGTTFEYAADRSDWQPMTNGELVRIMAAHVAKNAPANANRKWLDE